MKVLSSKSHTIAGLAVGLALLLAPQVCHFTDNQAATGTAIFFGIVIIISELITTSRFSPLKLVPMRTHLMADYLIGALLTLSPWLVGFASTSTNVWLPHLLLGILVIVYALITNPIDETAPSVVK